MDIKFDVLTIRHERRMTQKELAQKAGVSTAMISFIENAKRQPTVYVVALLARALNVRVEDIVTIKDDEYRYFK